MLLNLWLVVQYLDFPNQFPMTATTQGQPVDWNKPEINIKYRLFLS